MVVNKSVDLLLRNFPGRVIICTNLPKDIIVTDFDVFTTSGLVPKFEMRYFESLFSSFNVEKRKSIYIEHDLIICNKHYKNFNLFCWNNSFDEIDLLFYKLANHIYNIVSL